MRILAFVDIHEQAEYIEIIRNKAKHADILICAGDITIFENSMDEMLDFLESLGKKVLIIPGNHETDNSLEIALKDRNNITNIHRGHHVFQDVVFLGYGGGGFSTREHGFSEVESGFRDMIKAGKKSVFITHAPPHNTKLDEIGPNYHVGNKTFREFIEKTQPTISISGHIHETAFAADKIRNTIIINPGPEGIIINL